MSRTIRCNQHHLLIWSIPELRTLTQSTSAYRRQLLPGLFTSKEQPVRLRLVQTDRHQTHKCGYGYHKREYNRRYRKMAKIQLRDYIHTLEDSLESKPRLFYPYM